MEVAEVAEVAEAAEAAEARIAVDIDSTVVSRTEASRDLVVRIRWAHA